MEDEYDLERMASQVGALTGEEALTVRERLIDVVEAHTGNAAPEDDRTVVVIRVDTR